MNTKLFWVDALERAVKTAAQFLATALVGSAVTSIDWTLAAEGAGVAGLLSVLTSVASSKVSPAGTAALFTAAPAAPTAGA